MSYNIAKMVAYRRSFTCQICHKQKFSKMYEYQAEVIVPGYKPEHFKKVCGNCVYKETYGTNYYKAKKKEGALDGQM